jgi:enoyl-CoA hydratase/carnithine racemase
MTSATASGSTCAPPARAGLDPDFVETDVRDGVRYLKLARPPVSAHDTQMLLELDRPMTAVFLEDGVRAVVLASDKDRSFSVVADIAVIREEKPCGTAC